MTGGWKSSNSEPCWQWLRAAAPNPASSPWNTPPKDALKTVVLVGKGVTFDSGGINLKPSGSIETMKMDMSGAAAVAGTMMAVAHLKPEIKVVGVMPLVENMPSGAAIRPGDIIRSYTGKTIEIGNTDAEGRLILIDAMAWAIEQYKPDTLIDLATLTGACVVALGEKIAGVFSKDPDAGRRTIVASGEKTHERCWHLPLPEDYKELLKNDFADHEQRQQRALGRGYHRSPVSVRIRWRHALGTHRHRRAGLGQKSIGLLRCRRHGFRCAAYFAICWDKL